MSWRRFVALYRNLSAYGAVAARANELIEEMEEEDHANDQAQATAFFYQMLQTKG